MSHDPDRHYYSPATSQLLKSLTKLEHERQLQFLATQVVLTNNNSSSGSDVVSSASLMAEGDVGSTSSSEGHAGIPSSSFSPSSSSSVAHTPHSSTSSSSPLTDAHRTVSEEFSAVKDSAASTHMRTDQWIDDVLSRPLIIIIRHGKTEHNKLGLFTGKSKNIPEIVF